MLLSLATVLVIAVVVASLAGLHGLALWGANVIAFAVLVAAGVRSLPTMREASHDDES
jgi:hypothetical protein